MATLKQILLKTQQEAQIKMQQQEQEALSNNDGSKNNSRKPSREQQESRNTGSRVASRKYDRVLSTKALQIGQESGITAEFITKQTAEQTVFFHEGMPG